MATVAPITNIEHSQNFSKTHFLMVDIGSDLLRKFLEIKLKNDKLDIKAHLQDPSTQDKVKAMKKQKLLFKPQIDLLKSPTPDLAQMDISLLTKIILNTIKIPKSEEDLVNAMRDDRNKLSHAVGCSLPGLDLFNKGKSTIEKLASTMGKATLDSVMNNIAHLEKRVLVCEVRSLDVVNLRSEQLSMKLVSNTDGVEGKYFFMPPPFEKWWRGIKCYPCPCVRLCARQCIRPSVIKIWCPLNNF